MKLPTTKFRSMPGTALLMLLAGFGLPACEREEPIGPPRIHFGQDMCDVCHMIISDDRYAAAIVTEGERGHRTRLVFDDIGCIFEFEAQYPDRLVERFYVRDYLTREWIDADQSIMVHSRNLHTPMAFGLAALASPPQAEQVHGEFGGDVIDLAEARQRFALGALHVERIELDLALNEADAAVDPATIIAFADGRRLQVISKLPAEIRPGQHAFELELLSWLECGHWRPTTDAFTIEIEPEMPSMGHGSPGNEHPQPTGDGSFRGLVNFTMRGHWVVHVTVLENGAAAGTVSLHFEVQ